MWSGLTYLGGTHGTLSGSATASIAERLIEDTVTFAASSSETVTFDVPHPDDKYTVGLDSDLAVTVIGDIPSVANKVAASFDITFSSSVNDVVDLRCQGVYNGLERSRRL